MAFLRTLTYNIMYYNYIIFVLALLVDTKTSSQMEIENDLTCA